MKKLQVTTQFKKDLKRYKHKSEVLDELEAILKLLVSGKPIPEINRPHVLMGNYKGYMECHIENDILLIWWDKDEEVIKLVRFGTHSEIF